MKLTKEIIKKLNRDTSKGFLYYGKILGSDIYMSIRPHGGKQGNPLYFAVDDSGEIEWLKGLDVFARIRQINPKPQLVSPELVYLDL